MADPTRPGDPPPADVSALILLLTGLALQHLGEVGEGEEGQDSEPRTARHFIDLLGTLEEKTAGNLNSGEQALLSGVLDDLRVRYLKASREEERLAQGDAQ